MPADSQPAETETTEAQRWSFERLRDELPLLIESLTDAVVVVDREHHVRAANRRYLETFGPSCVHRTAEGCPLVPACDERASTSPKRGGVCEVRQPRQPVRRLRNVPDRSGVLRAWEATFTPVMNDGGEIECIVEVWRDIHERTPLEAQLAHSERLSSLGLLAAGVAHEINNPMASLLSGVERLQRWFARLAEVAPEARAEPLAVLEGLEREVLRCRETTEKLLLLAAPYPSAPIWVDLNRAVHDTLSLIDHQMRRQCIKRVEKLDPALRSIWARESGVRGVCLNLTLNAVQAMDGGGTLTVRTLGRGSRVVLEVEDTGPGIPPQNLDRIWDPFFTTKPPGKGTGLGLSIARQVITRHGGMIRVETPEGGGARFIVELPVTPAGTDLG